MVIEKQGLYMPNGTFRSREEIDRKLSDEPSTENAVLKGRQPQEIEMVAKGLGVGVDVIMGTINRLREKGYHIEQQGDKVVHSTAVQGGRLFDFKDRFIDRNLHFGVISDTHLASKQERLDALNGMYDTFEREGIKFVFHAGDISDGWGVYRGQEFEVKSFGQDEQVKYVVAEYPKRKGITTAFITGNHDLRQYERGGIDVGVPISHERPDLIYLGQAASLVEIGDGVNMEIVHPAGGTAYAMSYKPQRAINNMTLKDAPNILVYGHYHNAFYMHYRDIDFLQAGSFKDQGIFEKRLGLNPTIGGWIVDARISSQGGKVERFRPELFTF